MPVASPPAPPKKGAKEAGIFNTFYTAFFLQNFCSELEVKLNSPVSQNWPVWDKFVCEQNPFLKKDSENSLFIKESQQKTGILIGIGIPLKL